MATQVPGATLEFKATPNDQLQAIRGKQADYTEQLKTNTTTAANVGRLGRADALEAQKQQAKQAAAASGRPWTNADEREWADRATRFQQQSEDAMLLGREATIGASIAAEANPVIADIEQQATQKSQQMQAAAQGQAAVQDQVNLAAQQEYQQALLKAEQQRLALQQSQQLQSQMYGPMGPASYTGGMGAPAAPTNIDMTYAAAAPAIQSEQSMRSPGVYGSPSRASARTASPSVLGGAGARSLR